MKGFIKGWKNVNPLKKMLKIETGNEVKQEKHWNVPKKNNSSWQSKEAASQKC